LPSSPSLPTALKKESVALPKGRYARLLFTCLEIPQLDARTALRIVLDAIEAGTFARNASERHATLAFLEDVWRRSRKLLMEVGARLKQIEVPATAADGSQHGWAQADEAYLVGLGRETPLWKPCMEDCGRSSS
jgi:hypothetical protein